MKCEHCHHEVIRVTYGATSIDLDALPTTWVTIEEHETYPKEGDKVYRSTALVEHAAVCRGVSRRQEGSLWLSR
jgi:hypothetical protein